MKKKQFGGKPNPELEEQYAQSPQWQNGHFENLEETTMNINIWSMPKLLYKQFIDKKDREPKKPLPMAKYDKEAFLADDVPFKYVWYGHSVVLIRMNGKTILIDPMMGPNAAPISPFAVKRYSENTLDIIDEWPEIDLVLQTHDHYDHLDLASMEKLIPKVKQFYVAMGCKRHLTFWGADATKIKEFDWWDFTKIDDISITFTPTRHFSGRGLKDRAKSLWGGWALRSKDANIYFSGDGGYGRHFKEVGRKLGPFDFAFMECGQYNENWHMIHMFPEESVKAANEAKVKKASPVHWGGFSLAQHTWTDPANRFAAAAEKENLPTAYPELGKVYGLENSPEKHWW
ncbi:MAG: MBL fold metallo-hydrolase [Bacteroidia bacterium]